MLDVLCKFYHFKELVDKNLNSRHFSQDYSESLNEEEKRKYINERRVYDSIFTNQQQICQYANEIEEYSTFDASVICNSLIRILEADKSEKFIYYYSPFMIPNIAYYGRKYEVEQKVEIVIVPENSTHKPNSLEWFKNNIHTHDRNIDMFFVSGVYFSSPIVPYEWDYSNDGVLIMGSKYNNDETDRICFYVFFGYGLYPNTFDYTCSVHVSKFIDKLILYRINGKIKNISPEQVDDFCTTYIEEEILKSKNNEPKRKLSIFC